MRGGGEGVELVALEPQLKQKSLAVEKLMDKLQTDQNEADKVGINWSSAPPPRPLAC